MTDLQSISLTDLQRHWFEHLQACDAAGKGMATYASEHGLDVKALYAGKNTLVKKGVLPRTRQRRFTRAQVAPDAVHGAWRIQLPNGLSVVFSGTVDGGALSAVLTTAAAVD